MLRVTCLTSDLIIHVKKLRSIETNCMYREFRNIGTDQITSLKA